MHPLLNLIARRPSLLAEHVQAYAGLVAVELPLAASAWKRNALLNTVAALGLFAAVLLAGVALMLWAALPALSMPTPWLLIVVPLLPATAAIGCLIAAQIGVERDLLGTLRQQVSAAVTVLREAGLLAP